MTVSFRPLSPVDGQPFAERVYATPSEVETVLQAASTAKATWAATPLEERIQRVRGMSEALLGDREVIEAELTRQMGRPIRFCPGEITGFVERSTTMLDLAEEAMADIELPEKESFVRFIRREPLGAVLVMAPWNYPWLTSVNAIVPALAAGNVVVLKHSEQTPLVAERYQGAADAAGIPPGVFQFLHLTHDQIGKAIGDTRIDHVMFTGSVDGGRAVHKAAAARFIACGLELGGKDPAYVRPDAPFDHTVANVMDGAFFNSGQSCCGIERVYVHADLFDRFVDAAVAELEGYVLGDPTDPATTLGPMVRTSNADAVRRQVDAAVAAGARPLLKPEAFVGRELGPQYLPPQLLVNVDHAMEIMQEETFGPVVGVMKVESDEEAIARMNDSRYGLTASIWTTDIEAATSIGTRLETGTCFMNRADYLDPELAWVGVKDSGRGCTLSRVGYEHLTRPKSFHLRVVR